MNTAEWECSCAILRLFIYVYIYLTMVGAVGTTSGAYIHTETVLGHRLLCCHVS